MSGTTRIVAVVGARPQFIKAAVVSHCIRRVQGLDEWLVHTGQHYDENMSAVFFDEMELRRPDHTLGIGSGTHGQQTGRMLEAIESILIDRRPDWVLVYGDTNSTAAGALAAAKLHIPIAHVEAGLRSRNRRMPEEINRIVTDHLSDLLLVPTQQAVQNLTHEGIPEDAIHHVGDVMYDAVLRFARSAEQRSDIMKRLNLEKRGYILATIHRAENTDDEHRLRTILEALAWLANRGVVVVFPLHPRTRAATTEAGLAPLLDQVHCIEPVGYLDMTKLESNARFIITDSGGVQKEAFFHNVRCVTFREQTEWVELVESGWNTLIAPTDDLESVCKQLDTAMHLPHEGPPIAPYGDGRAAERIVALLHGSTARGHGSRPLTGR